MGAIARSELAREACSGASGRDTPLNTYKEDARQGAKVKAKCAKAGCEGGVRGRGGRADCKPTGWCAGDNRRESPLHVYKG